MNIHSLNTDAASRAYVQNTDAARSNAGRADGGKKDANKASRVDSVVLSDNAKSLAAARAAVDGASDVRNEKVAEIKQRVQDGTYAVDAKVLARKMLKDSQ